MIDQSLAEDLSLLLIIMKLYYSCINLSIYDIRTNNEVKFISVPIASSVELSTISLRRVLKCVCRDLVLGGAGTVHLTS